MQLSPVAPPTAAAPTVLRRPMGPTRSLATVAPVPPAASEHERLLIERMDAGETFRDIEVLAAEPRVWKTPGYEKALNHVVEQLRAAGWDARVEEHKSSGGWMGSGLLRNVVAERRGTAPDGERGLVVAGAHLDSVRGAPGANDNASGSATLLELARSLEGIETANDLKLIWFDGEEAGLLGSIAHVKANPQDTARTVQMINMDMVGSPNGQVGFDLGIGTSNAVADAMRGVMERTGLQGQMWPDRHSRSDHASFDRVGIPAVDFGVSVRGVTRQDPNYHSPRDVASQINKDVLEGYGDLIAVTVLDAANRPARLA